MRRSVVLLLLTACAGRGETSAGLVRCEITGEDEMRALSLLGEGRWRDHWEWELTLD